MTKRIFHFLILFASASVLILGVSIFNFSKSKVLNGKTINISRINKLFIETKTICMGRFLIDVPKKAKVVYGPADVPFPILVYKGNASSMQTMMDKRLTEISEEKNYVEGKLLKENNIVGKVFDGVLPGQKLLVGVSQQSGVFYRIHSYLPHGADIFVQESDAFSEKEEYEGTMQELNSLALLLRPRGELEIPSAPGVCIEDGFVMEPSESMREYVTLGIRMDDYPDVHFSMSTTNKMKWVSSDALEPLLKRGEENARANGQGAWYDRIKNLRKGQRQLGQWKGFEILARLPAQKVEGPSHEFKYLSQGQPKNPNLPMLELELHTGVHGNKVGSTDPSLSDEEAVLLWDKLTNSIRIRPTTPNPNPER